jgi:hypothetical protein
MKAKATVSKHEHGTYGIDRGGAILYESSPELGGFNLEVARRIVQLENSDNPPIDWEETELILRDEGYNL